MAHYRHLLCVGSIAVSTRDRRLRIRPTLCLRTERRNKTGPVSGSVLRA
jgi:hypothetical protein